MASFEHDVSMRTVIRQHKRKGTLPRLSEVCLAVTLGHNVIVLLDDLEDFTFITNVEARECSGMVFFTEQDRGREADVFLESLRAEGVTVPSFFTKEDVFEHAYRLPSGAYEIKFVLVNKKS